MAAEYTVKMTLPSRGILYDKIPAEITMRSMKTSEEKIIFASTGGDIFKRILEKCIVEPENINMDDMIYSDEHALILKLRQHTYGSDYNVSAVCPECDAKSTFTVDLSEFPINYLDESFVEPFDIVLPKSADTLSVRLLRNRDSDIIERQAKKIAKATHAPQREIEYTLRMAKYIVAINGEKVELEDARAYVEDMQGLDSAYFWDKINSIKVGVDSEVVVDCPECGEEFSFNLPINSEFFRPKFGDR